MRVHEVPTAILLRKTALKASVGNDPIDRRPGSGGHLGRAIPHGTGITLAHRTDTRVGKGKSLAQTAREALAEKFRPSKEEIWAAADRLRQKIGKVSGDSTADIREWRDNNEPYR